EADALRDVEADRVDRLDPRVMLHEVAGFEQGGHERQTGTDGGLTRHSERSRESSPAPRGPLSPAAGAAAECTGWSFNRGIMTGWAHKRSAVAGLDRLDEQIGTGRLCVPHLPLGPRAVVRLGGQARVLVIGQAPGTKVHATGVPWNDASGER